MKKHQDKKQTIYDDEELEKVKETVCKHTYSWILLDSSGNQLTKYIQFKV